MPLPLGRGWPVLAAVALAGAAVLVATWWADGGGPAGADRVHVGGALAKLPDAALDRSDPVAVATAFARRYAANDPVACQLADQHLRATLQQGGRCSGTTARAAEPVTVLHSRTCGDRHGQSMQVPHIDGGQAPYVTLSLRRTGDEWSVVAVLPVRERAVISPYECAEPSW